MTAFDAGRADPPKGPSGRQIRPIPANSFNRNGVIRPIPLYWGNPNIRAMGGGAGKPGSGHSGLVRLLPAGKRHGSTTGAGPVCSKASMEELLAARKVPRMVGFGEGGTFLPQRVLRWDSSKASW